MSGTAEPTATPAAHSGATFVKADDAPASPAATPAPAVAATPAPAAAAPAVDPAKPALVGNLVADPAKPADPAADPAKDPAKDAPKDPAKPVDLNPADYKIEYPPEVPDGAKDPMVAGFLPVAAKHGLSNETVQALISEIGPVIRNQQNTAFEGLQQSWQQEWKADPKIGGANLEPTLALIRNAVTTYADSPEHAGKINEAMVITGAGNHPAINRLIANMAKRLAEGTPVNGIGSPAPQKSAGDVLYNNPTSRPGAQVTRG